MKKFNETENRVIVMKNVLENNIDNKDGAISIQPTLMLSNERVNRTNTRPKRIFGEKMKSIDDMTSSQTSNPLMFEEFKRVAYQKVSEIEHGPELKLAAPINKSFIFSDRDGKLNVSRSNNPFAPSVDMLESKDFVPITKMIRK